MKKKLIGKEKSGFAVLIVLIALALALLVFNNVKTGSSTSHKQNVLQGLSKRNSVKFSKVNKSEPYVARLVIDDVIQEKGNTYNQEWLLATIDSLQKDKNNMAIILYLDTPGGTVYEADEAYLKLCDYAKEKPVYAYFSHMSASGGYYIACSSKYIMANRNSECGCIGVIAGQFIDITGLLEKYDIKVETIHSGRNKVMGSMTEKLTDEQRAIRQSVCDEAYDRFVRIVAKGRNLSIEKSTELADGRLYTAKQAKENKLIDEVGSWNDLLNVVWKNETEGKPLNVIDYCYKKDETFYDFITKICTQIGGQKANAVIPSPIMKVIEPGIEFPAYIYIK